MCGLTIGCQKSGEAARQNLGNAADVMASLTLPFYSVALLTTLTTIACFAIT